MLVILNESYLGPEKSISVTCLICDTGYFFDWHSSGKTDHSVSSCWWPAYIIYIVYLPHRIDRSDPIWPQVIGSPWYTYHFHQLVPRELSAKNWRRRMSYAFIPRKIGQWCLNEGSKRSETSNLCQCTR